MQRHLEAEDGILAELDVAELARQHRAEECTRGLDRHPVALAERSAGPAGVDQPDRRVVPVELLAEQLRVDGRPLRPERRAEAVEKVGCGSVTPSSVPASFDVYPERKKKSACSRLRRAIGGRIPKASAARKITERGWPARFVGSAFAICSSL